MNLAWITDLHLERHKPFAAKPLGEYLVKDYEFDALLITGDISHAPRLKKDLLGLRDGIAKPIYYVLGNHDYYGSSVAKTKEELATLLEENLTFLDSSPIVSVDDGVTLCGVGGMYDIRFGMAEASTFIMPCNEQVEEFSGFGRKDRLKRIELIRKIADDDAMLAKQKLTEAAKVSQKVYFATHYPPFRETCLDGGGKISSDITIPFFGSKVMGDVLTEVSSKYPNTQFVVLCGHTHNATEQNISSNLNVRVGKSEIGFPDVSAILEIGS